MRRIKVFAIFPLLVLVVGAVSWGAAQTGALRAPAEAAAGLPAGTATLPQAAPQVRTTGLPHTPTSEQAAVSPSPAPTDAGPSPTPTPAYPAQHYILDIRGHKQYFPLGCEAAVAKDWANYFGKDFNEFEFQYRLPASDNPELGFVGDVNSPWGQTPPYGYGVYAGPIADLLNAYDIPARAYKGYTLDQVKAQLAQDRPVIAWVIGNMVGGVPAEYTDVLGNKVLVAAYEHTVILTGYNEKKIRYMTNGRFYEASNEVFLNSWGVLGNMVVTVD